MRSRRLHLLLIPAAALLCILPLLREGPSCGHDLDFHLVSWLEAAGQISAGNLHPHWASTPAFGAGEPRFVFYPPLSWTAGALLTLLLTHLPSLTPANAFTLAPILYTFLALTTAGLAMYALARRYAPPPAALVAATLYLSNPYTLFTAFERTALAELLAATWLPLLLLAILPPPDREASQTASAEQTRPTQQINLPLLALTVALLWLTNAPAAVMACYTVATVAIARLVLLYRTDRNLRPLLHLAAETLAGTSLGLALAAFYILPAAYERRWVEIALANVPGMRIADNTLFHHTGDLPHDDVLHTASTIALLLLAVTTLALLAATLRTPSAAGPQPNPSRPTSSSPSLTAGIAFLLTPLAAPIWQHLPELAFLQFPWRTLAILAPIAALAAALALRSVPLRPPLAIALSLALPAALSYGAYTHFYEGCDPPDAPDAQLALFHSSAGSEPTDEYTPSTADNDALKPGTPALQALGPAPVPPNPTPHGPAPRHLLLSAKSPEDLVLNLRDYPAWHVERNGAPVTERIPRSDGLIAFHIPAGESSIDIRYATTPDTLAGDAISLLALPTFALLLLRRSILPRRREPAPAPAETRP